MRPLDLDLETWDPWSPAEAAERLRGVSAPWYVLAGWALDLFLGRQTRTHGDLEIGVPADRFAEVRQALFGLELVVVGDGKAWPLNDETLSIYPQTWAREGQGPWRIDVMREPWDGETWLCRRDARIRLPSERLIARTSDGIPYAQPEVMLLFKAKAVRPKDEVDFEIVLPHLDGARRAWLHDALSAVHPGHAWLDALRAD